MLKVGFDFESSGLTMRLRCSGHFLRVSEMRFQLTILINFDLRKNGSQLQLGVEEEGSF